MNSSNFRSDIQVLRGIAVISVVLFHLDFQLFSNGYLGVDIFFVISGYLITPKIIKIYESTQETKTTYIKIKKFYKRRLLRLGPALGVTIIVTSILMMVIGKYNDLNRFISQAVYSTLGIANIGSYRNSGNYFNPDSNPLLHIWSLAIESQYYILIPILLFAWQKLGIILKYRLSYNIPLLIVFILSLYLFINSDIELKIARSFFPLINSEYLYYSLSSRIWQLLLGGFISIYIDEIPKKRFINKSLIKNFYFNSIYISIIAILIFILENPKWKIILVSIFTASVLTNEKLAFKKAKVFEWIGYRSYSMYLFHYPVIYFFKNAQDFGSIKLNPVIDVLIYIVILLFVSNLSYKFIEMRYWHSDQERESMRKVLTISFILPLVVILTIFSQKIYIKNDMFIQPATLEYGGRKFDPPVGFMDKICANQFRNNQVCVYGVGKESKTVVLMGDSYAEQYFKTLSTLASEMNFQLISMTFPGCRFVLSNNSSSNFSKKCIEFNRQSLEDLQLLTPDAVILSQALYSNEESSLLIEAIDVLNQLSADLIVVGNNPSFPDMNTYMVARPRLFRSFEPQKSFPRNSLDKRNFQLTSLILESMEKRSISTINPIPFFCDSKICWRWLNEEWLFIDGNHLTVFGADLLAPAFKRLLELPLR